MTESLLHWLDLVKARGVRVLAIVLIALILNRLLRVVTSRMIVLAKSQSRLAKAREQQTRTMVGLLYSTGTAVILAAMILLALPEFGFNVTPVVAVAGLASLAVGFGGQFLVRDMINGFFILFEDQYSVGDTIQLNNEVGRVEHITLRRTVLRNPAGAMVTIPNGLVGQVSNLSRDWSQYFLDVIVSGEETVGRALELLEKIASEFRADPAWSPLLVDGPRLLGIESLALAGTTLRLQFRSVPTRQDDVARELRRRIRLGMESAGILLGATQRVIVSGPSVPAKTSEATTEILKEEPHGTSDA